MLFLTLEDTLGLCDVVFFPEKYKEYREMLQSYGPFTITGKVQSRIKGEANLIVEKVYRWPSPSQVVSKVLAS